MDKVIKIDSNIRLRNSEAEPALNFQPGTLEAIRVLHKLQLAKDFSLDLSSLREHEYLAFMDAASVYKRGVAIHSSAQEAFSFSDESWVKFYSKISSLNLSMTKLRFDWVVCDPNVFQMWKDFFSTSNILFFESTEKNKSLDAVVTFLKNHPALCRENLNVLVIGGGVLSDVFGFVGCRWKWNLYLAPTTLLSQVDAAHGGKNALNVEEVGKNIIGSYYSPKGILCCTEFLASLSDLEWKSGCVEALKHAYLMQRIDLVKDVMDLMRSRDLVKLNEILETLVNFKRDIVQKDGSDSNLRNILNFGHTVGHALEAFGIFQTKTQVVPHGLAVLFGMLVEMKLAMDCKQCSKQEFFLERIREIEKDRFYLNESSLFCLQRLKESLDAREVFYQFLIQDKKNSSGYHEQKRIYFSRFWDVLDQGAESFTWNLSTDEFRNYFESYLG